MILDCGHPDNGDLCTVHERDCTFHGQGVCVCPTVCPACCPECTTNERTPRRRRLQAMTVKSGGYRCV